jgi:hypothetical protein
MHKQKHNNVKKQETGRPHLYRVAALALTHLERYLSDPYKELAYEFGKMEAFPAVLDYRRSDFPSRSINETFSYKGFTVTQQS